MAPIIAPSLLAANFGDLRSEITNIERAGADWLHIDVMDGTFVPPITFGANMVSLAKTHSTLPLDVHLMIVNPGDHIKTFADCGASSLTIHQEVSPHLYRQLEAIKKLGMRSGVAINPGTAIETVFDSLEVADIVLVMTVNPGWGGQSFIDGMLSKIERLKQEIEKRKLKTFIEVDGGIDPITASACVVAGASILVAGSSVFSHSDRAHAIRSLRS